MVIPDSAAIDYSKLFSQSHANIYNLLNTRSNIADPTGIRDRKFVYVREPRAMATDFNDYPVIIVEPIDMTQVNADVKGDNPFITYTVMVRVWSADTTKDVRGNPSAAETMNNISNDIVKTINANRTTLRGYGMYNFEITDTDSSWEEVNEQMVFMREFTLEFRQREKVVA